MQNDEFDPLGGFRKPLLILDVSLVGIGGFILLYTGIVVFQIINEPGSVHIVDLVLENVKIDETVATLSHNSAKTEFSLSKSARLIIFLFFGVLILSVLTGILRALISGGIVVIKVASEYPRNRSE